MKDIDQLIEKARLGQANAFEKLYKLTSKEIYWYCRRLCGNNSDAEDLMQEVYLTAWKKLSQYKGINFHAWLRSIAHNSYLNQLKKYNRNQEILCDESIEAIAEDELLGPENIVLQKQIRSLLLKTIESELTSVQRMTVMMFYYDELTVGEIADKMECSEGTVKSRLYLARKKMRDKLEETGSSFFSGVPYVFPLLHYEAAHSQKPALFFRKSILPHIAERATGISIKVIALVSGGAGVMAASVLVLSEPFLPNDKPDASILPELAIETALTDQPEETLPMYATIAENATSDAVLTDITETTSIENETVDFFIPTTAAASDAETVVSNEITSITYTPTDSMTQASHDTTYTTTVTQTTPTQPDIVHQDHESSVIWTLNSQGILTIESGTGYTTYIDDFYEEVENPDPLERVETPYLPDQIMYATWHIASDSNTVIIIDDSILRIGGYAFYQMYADSVYIPDSVTWINKMAFAEAAFNEIRMPVQLKIYEDDIFTNARLGKVIYPEGTTNVNGTLLSKAEQVTEIELPSTLEKICENEFTDCQGLEKITILNPAVPFPDEQCLPETVTIYGISGSTAQEYAEKYGFAFEVIS